MAKSWCPFVVGVRIVALVLRMAIHGECPTLVMSVNCLSGHGVGDSLSCSCPQEKKKPSSSNMADEMIKGSI